MRKYIAFVDIAGNRNHVVRKVNLSAAELLVLNAIHGEGSVHDIKEDFRNKSNVNHETLRAHLERTYKGTRVAVGDNRIPVLKHVFPDWPRGELPADVKAARISETLLAKPDVVAPTLSTSEPGTAPTAGAAGKASSKKGSGKGKKQAPPTGEETEGTGNTGPGETSSETGDTGPNSETGGQEDTSFAE